MKVEILQKWWHVESQTRGQLAKILWTPHKKHNLKTTLLWNLRNYTTTSRYVSIQWLASEKNFFLITSPPKETLILKNILYQIVIILPILVTYRPTLSLDTHFWWYRPMTPVQNIPWHLSTTRLSTLMNMKYWYGKFYPDFSSVPP